MPGDPVSQGFISAAEAEKEINPFCSGGRAEVWRLPDGLFRATFFTVWGAVVELEGSRPRATQGAPQGALGVETGALVVQYGGERWPREILPDPERERSAARFPPSRS